MERQSTRLRIRSYRVKFRKWITSSTSHGIPAIFRSKNPIIRIMWTLVFLASCGYCVSAITKSIMEFLKHKTTLSSHQIQDIPAPFPAITFCNLNPFNEYHSFNHITTLANAMEKPECLDYLRVRKKCEEEENGGNSTLCIDNNSKLNEHCMATVDFTFYKLRRFIAEKVSDDIFRKEDLGFDLFRDIMYDCIINKQKCKKSDFTSFWTHRFGSCYTFNSDANDSRIYKTNQKGYENGLQLRLILKAYDENPNSEFTSRTGLYLVVHNQSTVPFTLNKGVFLSLGYETNIIIDRVFTRKLAAPYSKCIDELKSDNPYSQRLFGFFRDLNITYYDQDLCFIICYQDKLVDQCGCLNTKTPKIRNASYCYTDSELDCMNGDYSENLTRIYRDYCIDACPEKLNTVDYQLKVDNADFPTLSHLIYLKKKLSQHLPNDRAKLKQFGKEAFLALNIYYENLHYTFIEENASITTETLLGNVGGQLGLFIGISFLSFIELIEVAIEFLNIFYRKRKQANSIKPNEEEEKNQQNNSILFTISK